MFNSIASSYDLVNTVLSFGIHHSWRSALKGILPDGKRALDLCTGTGDLLPILSGKYSEVVGGDFSRSMLLCGRSKGVFNLAQSDALSLPFKDESFDVVTIAFGVRNFEDLRLGLRESRRVLKRGGSIIVLEFGQPFVPGFSMLFKVYSKWIMPIVGGLLSGNRAAYEYLPKTSAAFPCRSEFEAILRLEGFAVETTRPLTGGIAYLYKGIRV